MLNRLNGAPFALNPDLIERVESTPDTIITLVDGKHYIVAESMTELIERIRHARAEVLADVATASYDRELRVVADAPTSSVIPMRRNP
jgi:flagellar protein FlbD